jgi:Mitochondrial carrier protein
MREEGVGAFYRGLPPRLVSVVPMIGIQFGVYEFIKRMMLQRKIEAARLQLLNDYSHINTHSTSTDDESTREAVLMEVAASIAHPYPVPHMSHHQTNEQNST